MNPLHTLHLSNDERARILVDRDAAAKRAEVAMNEMVFAAVEREINADIDRLCNDLEYVSDSEHEMLMRRDIEHATRDELLAILKITRSIMLRNDILDYYTDASAPFSAPNFYDANMNARQQSLCIRKGRLSMLRRGERC
jgi:hypothetical protein